MDPLYPASCINKTPEELLKLISKFLEETFIDGATKTIDQITFPPSKAKKADWKKLVKEPGKYVSDGKFNQDEGVLPLLTDMYGMFRLSKLALSKLSSENRALKAQVKTLNEQREMTAAGKGASTDREDQSEPTLKDLKKGLDELKGIMTTNNITRGPSAQVSDKDCSTLSVMMSDKLHGLSEIIITTVKEEFVKSSEKMQVAVVGALKEKTTSFADMVKRGNSDIMEGTKQIVTESNTESRERTQEKLADDHWQREKRKKNVVIREVKELDTDKVEDRKEFDMKFLTQVCNIMPDDIDHAFRAGKLRKRGDPVPLRRNGKPVGPRPLICVLKDEAMVMSYTNEGRGDRVEVKDLASDGDEMKYYFINRDLCPTDALADFRLRQMRKSNQV